MKYKYNQELPKEVEDKLDAFLERIKAIKWFQPQTEINKEEVEKEVNFYLSCFGFTAGIEYRELRTEKDWASTWASSRDSSRDSAWASALASALDSARASAWAWASDSAWASSRDSAWASARASAWDSSRDSAWDSSRDSAWDSSRAIENILVEDLPQFKEKYPNGTFKNIIPIWERGLYPVGIINGKFVIYVPPVKLEFPVIK